MMRRQVAAYMVKHYDVMGPIIVTKLDPGESFADFCQRTFFGQIWGDHSIMQALALMWKCSISVVTPGGIENILHSRDPCNVDLFVAFNGHDHFTCAFNKRKSMLEVTSEIQKKM
jgi:hypothetical protein